ncbi:unnamed protein product [Arabidopsis lyrata]|uniref:Predicted protein n=1 Tax=Arabidopsis lyrata subsp. lyrata TaxID=81972 RepID=D7MU12_ARALL|nr:predicted protein [Arabidopsis lyrata subsp. lyrata]CAH8278192.1 unnamed protein product [Arabidopsis lyrata]
MSVIEQTKGWLQGLKVHADSAELKKVKPNKGLPKLHRKQKEFRLLDSIEITSHLEITTVTRVDESSEGYRHQSPSPTSTESGEKSIAETSHEESLFTTEFDLNGAQYKKTTKGNLKQSVYNRSTARKDKSQPKPLMEAGFAGQKPAVSPNGAGGYRAKAQITWDG